MIRPFYDPAPGIEGRARISALGGSAIRRGWEEPGTTRPLPWEDAIDPEVHE